MSLNFNCSTSEGSLLTGSLIVMTHWTHGTHGHPPIWPGDTSFQTAHSSRWSCKLPTQKWSVMIISTKANLALAYLRSVTVSVTVSVTYSNSESYIILLLSSIYYLIFDVFFIFFWSVYVCICLWVRAINLPCCFNSGRVGKWLFPGPLITYSWQLWTTGHNRFVLPRISPMACVKPSTHKGTGPGCYPTNFGMLKIPSFGILDPEGIAWNWLSNVRNSAPSQVSSMDHKSWQSNQHHFLGRLYSKKLVWFSNYSQNVEHHDFCISAK